MSDTLLIYRDQADTMHLIDPDAVPHLEVGDPVLVVVRMIVNAGFKGVIVHQEQLRDGRYFLGLNTNAATPEGCIGREIYERRSQELSVP